MWDPRHHPPIAHRGIELRERLGRRRWVVKRGLAWLLTFRRLGVRFARRADVLHELLPLAYARLCLRALRPPA